MTETLLRHCRHIDPKSFERLATCPRLKECCSKPWWNEGESVCKYRLKDCFGIPPVHSAWRPCQYYED